ncbi:MAG: hypothetical protein SFW35_09955 [Chitinophagales bacterium]|nr:hypothetical protein [Chitinophagales bacterium]
MKRAFAILLISIFIFNEVGHLCIFLFERMAVRKEVKHSMLDALDNGKLLAFSFSKQQLADLDWEDEHEFRLQGKMYDVVRREIKDGLVTLYCYSDDQETQLLAGLEKEVEKRMAQAMDLEKLKKQSIYHFVKLADYSAPIFCGRDKFGNFSFIYTSPILQRPGPPPDLLV